MFITLIRGKIITMPADKGFVFSNRVFSNCVLSGRRESCKENILTMCIVNCYQVLYKFCSLLIQMFYWFWLSFINMVINVCAGVGVTEKILDRL